MPWTLRKCEIGRVKVWATAVVDVMTTTIASMIINLNLHLTSIVFLKDGEDVWLNRSLH